MAVPHSSQVLGKRGEEAAAEFLRKRGFRIHETNYRCTFGELDIVASEGDVLVFVEVRARSDSGFGSPAESVGPKKQRKLRQVAEAYLQAHYSVERRPKSSRAVAPPLAPRIPGEMPNCRIDVVVIELGAGGNPGHIELIRDAVGQ